jgi:hypothetical protein
MFMSLAMLFAFVASIVLPILGVMAIVTFIRRGRQFPGTQAEGSSYGAILDSLEQVHLRLDALSGRLTRIESHLDAEQGRDLEAPEAQARGFIGDGSNEDTPAQHRQRQP